MQGSPLEEAMALALEEARKALDRGEVPVGAVILDPDGGVVARDHNRKEELSDPTAHAELLVLRAAAGELGDWRLIDHTLVTTLEPCPMCAGAAVWSRLSTVAYGASDPKAGAVWSLYNITGDERLNHQCEQVAGVLEEECSEVLSDFFAKRRQ